MVKWGALGRQKNYHGLDRLIRENSECGKQCRSESMRAELRLLRQPFFFFTLLLLSHHPQHFPHSASKSAFLKRQREKVTLKVKWRCVKLHRYRVQFSAFHLSKIGEFSRVQKKAKNQRCRLLTLPLKAKLGNFRLY